jgi:hypothetical protein
MMEQKITIVGDGIECFVHPVGRFYNLISATVVIETYILLADSTILLC